MNGTRVRVAVVIALLATGSVATLVDFHHSGPPEASASSSTPQSARTTATPLNIQAASPSPVNTDAAHAYVYSSTQSYGTTAPIPRVTYTAKPACDAKATCGKIIKVTKVGETACELTLGKPYRGRTISLYTQCPPTLPFDYEFFTTDQKTMANNSLIGELRWLVTITVADTNWDSSGCHISGTLLEPYWVGYYAGGESSYGVTTASQRDCVSLHSGTTAKVPNIWYAPVGNRQQWLSAKPNPGWHIVAPA